MLLLFEPQRLSLFHADDPNHLIRKKIHKTKNFVIAGKQIKQNCLNGNSFRFGLFSSFRSTPFPLLCRHRFKFKVWKKAKKFEVLWCEMQSLVAPSAMTHAQKLFLQENSLWFSWDFFWFLAGFSCQVELHLKIDGRWTESRKAAWDFPD